MAWRHRVAARRPSFGQMSDETAGRGRCADRAAPQGRRDDRGRGRRGQAGARREGRDRADPARVPLRLQHLHVGPRAATSRRKRPTAQRFAELLNYATLPFYWSSYEPRRGEPEPRHAPSRSPAGARSRASSPRGIRWRGTTPIRGGCRTIRTRCAGCRWRGSTTACARFAGLIDRWDVVNEATHFDRDEFLAQRAEADGACGRRLGQIEFTRECFEHARQGRPQGDAADQRLPHRSGLRAS